MERSCEPGVIITATILGPGPNKFVQHKINVPQLLPTGPADRRGGLRASVSRVTCARPSVVEGGGGQAPKSGTGV